MGIGNVRKHLQASLPNNRIASRYTNLLINYLRNTIAHFQFKRSKQYQNRKDNRVSKPELESSSIANNTTLLLSDKNVSRGARRISGCKETKEEASKPAYTSTKEEGRVMPTQTLPAQHYIHFSYNFQSGFFRTNLIKFYVESEFPVDTYIVDLLGLQNFQAGREFTSYGGLINAIEHRQEIRAPREGSWYLIINNKGYQPTAIHYEVA
ncbi:hypothetical protein ES703_96183 [subsurface metagenome]